MNVPNVKRMTADEYAVWSERQETGRYELIDGMVVQMNAENAAHARVKVRVALALDRSLKQRAVPGEVYWDGMAVRITEFLVHEPDAMLRLGAPLPGETILVTDPVVVIEVLSPRSGPIDTGRKLTNYFMIDTLQHYLVVDTTKRLVLHYVRGDDGAPIMHAPISAGDIVLDPPGITISMDEVFE